MTKLTAPCARWSRRSGPSSSMTCLLLAALACSGCASQAAFRAEKTVRQTAEHLPGSALVVKSQNGTIRIIAAPDDEAVEVEATIKCVGVTQADADARLAAATLELSRRTDRTLLIQPLFPQQPRGGDGASLTIHLPDASGVEVETSNGNVVVNSVRGQLVVNTSNGSVEITNHDGPASIETSNGRVTVTRQSGELSIRTSNGGVQAGEVEGPITIGTSNAKVLVKLTSTGKGPIKIDTSNGSITVEAGPGFEGRVVMDTSNGSLTVDDQLQRIVSQRLGRNSGEVTVAGDGPSSTFDTSNGSIKLVLTE